MKLDIALLLGFVSLEGILADQTETTALPEC